MTVCLIAFWYFTEARIIFHIIHCFNMYNPFQNLYKKIVDWIAVSRICIESSFRNTICMFRFLCLSIVFKVTCFGNKRKKTFFLSRRGILQCAYIHLYVHHQASNKCRQKWDLQHYPIQPTKWKSRIHYYLKYKY